MLVEFNFDRKNLRADAGEIQAYLEQKLKKQNYPLPYKIVSVTIMSRWLVVLIEFPTLKNHPPRRVEFLWDALAGIVVLNFDVRYRHFTVHGEGPSLIYK
jgi:hypothetical protein